MHPPSQAVPGPDLSPRAVLLITVLGLNAVRLAFAPFFELVPQEAYYFLYSQHLALSYFDHPPVLAYVLRLFTGLLGRSELTLRVAMLTLSLLTQLVWLDLARKNLGKRWTVAAWWLLPTGMVTLTSLISTPDVPLLLCWAVAVHQLYGALFEGRRWQWLTAGLAMGLAFDSKYTGVLLQAGLGLYLLVSTEHRRWLRTPWPWASLLVAHGVMGPVYLWNFQHGFASFLFQTADRASHSSGPGLRWTLGLLGSQSALLGIPLFLALGALAFRPRRLLTAAPEEARGRRLFLACFFVPPFLLFVAVSVFALVKPNWMMPAYLTGVILVADLLPTRWLKANLAFSAVLHLLAGFELLLYPVRVQSDDTWKGWRELTRQVEARAAERPGVFIASADGYKTTAQLRFYSGLEVYGPNLIGQRGLQFDYTDPDLSPLVGRDALFIDSAPRDFTPDRGAGVPEEVAGHFASAVELEPILVQERGRVIRKFRVYDARGYRGRQP
ncbi:MAG: glycosyltransferase family 39 protein [Myxococcota bacterium]|nr:glycosyltransferase family 39 protein [Myxococcota bacterium]